MPPPNMLYRSALLGVLAISAASCGESPIEPSGTPPQAASVIPEVAVAPRVELTGPEVFSQHCALCHGEAGDGQGLVVFDKPARSFVQGAFSFGNTTEALFRTVSSGIGGTPMPGFREVLSEAERYAVVEHVIGLGPEPVVVTPGSTVMTVKEKPLVVRGSFPPVTEGDSMTPRGLLVGGLDGLSFQYDRSNMRLLAVRQGGFVDRRDWENRGGDTLSPLGRAIFIPAGERRHVEWVAASPASSDEPIALKLVATEIANGKALVDYDLLLGQKRVATVRESSEAVSFGGWTGFRRHFEISGEGTDPPLYMPTSYAAGTAETLETGTPSEATLYRGDSKGATIIFTKTSGATSSLTVTIDTLFGLEPTPENLAAFKGAL